MGMRRRSRRQSNTGLIVSNREPSSNSDTETTSPDTSEAGTKGAFEFLATLGVWNIPTTPLELITAAYTLLSFLIYRLRTSIHIARAESMVLGVSRWLRQSEAGDEDSNAGEVGEEMKPVKEERKKVLKRRRHKANEVSEDAAFFPGMVNLSGTLCYMNSVLQAFASIPSLLGHLEKIVQLAVEVDLPTPMTDALLDVLQDLNTPAKRQPPALRPVNLLHALQPLPAIRRLLSTREQQDAHELFLVLAEAVSDEAMKVAAEVMKSRGFGEILSLQGYLTGGGRDKAARKVREKRRALAQPWEGLMARRRVCRKCGWCETVRLDTLSGMELSVPLYGETTLEASIGQFLAPEQLDDVTCEMCSLRLTLVHYQMEVERLSSPPSQQLSNGHGNGHSRTNTGSGSFSALSDLPSNSNGIQAEAEGSMTASRKKRAREAKRVQNRLQEMLDSNTVTSFGESVLPPTLNSSALAVKWQTARTASIREAAITRPPPTLRLHLIRSEYTPYGQLLKKTARVAFPLFLDLTQFVANGIWEDRSVMGLLQQSQSKPQPGAGETPAPARILYRLESAILHFGYSHASGHYVCLRRKPVPKHTDDGTGIIYRPKQVTRSCPDGCRCEQCAYFGPVREENVAGRGWLRISDADVEEVGVEALMEARGQVFMLFYERVGEYEGEKKKNEAVQV